MSSVIKKWREIPPASESDRTRAKGDGKGSNKMVCVAEWLKYYEFVAIWLEGIALVAIFFLDWREYRRQGDERQKQESDRTKQHEETAAQMDIWRKQIHADRVAEIFKALRKFHNFLIRAVHINKTFGP